jgi:hypothetical protein
MSDKKRLYFIPMIDRALNSDQPEEALKEAFEEIREMGKEPKYKEGFRQFQDFIEMTVKLPGKEPEAKRQRIRNALYQLISDLVTDTFEGSPDQKESLIREFTKNPEWRVEYERIKEEMKPLLIPQSLLEIEVLKDDEMIASFPVSEVPLNLLNINPGRYTVRLSNGRVLWEGQLLKKNLLWLEARGDEDLQMAAKTEEDAPRPTLSELLLGGDLIMEVIPDLQSGEIRFSHGKQRR